MSGNGSPRTLKTVGLTFEVLQALRELNKAGVTEIADRLNISKGAAYNHLATLRENELVRKEDEKYCLGLRLMNWGVYIRDQHPLYQAGRSEVDKLADITGEYAHLMTEEFGWGIHLYNARGDQGVPEEFHKEKFYRPDYLHLTSTGKAILASLNEKRVEEIIAKRGLPKRTDQTLTTKGELFNEIERIREQGYATNESEELRKYRALGVPIMDEDDQVAGAISASGPAQRFDDEMFYNELPEIVMERANIIEVYLDSTREQQDEIAPL